MSSELTKEVKAGVLALIGVTTIASIGVGLFVGTQAPSTVHIGLWSPSRTAVAIVTMIGTFLVITTVIAFAVIYRISTSQWGDIRR